MNLSPCRRAVGILQDCVGRGGVLAALVCSLWGAGVPCAFAAEGSGPSANLLTNGGFELGLAGWRPFWSREKDAGAGMLESGSRHSGRASVRIEHRGSGDWSFEPETRVAVEPGELFELEAWIRMPAPENVLLCVSTWNAQGTAVDWSFGERSPAPDPGWQLVRSRFVAPPGVTHIQPRLIGYGSANLQVDDLRLVRQGRVLKGAAAVPAAALTLRSRALTLDIQPTNGAFRITDRASGRTWTQQPAGGGIFLLNATKTGGGLKLRLMQAANGLEFSASVRIQDRELVVELEGQGDLAAPLRYPHPFASDPGEYVVIPMNEGISYPVEDASVPLHRLIAYGGHGICMAFFGSTDGARGWMGILETADDASIQLLRTEGRLGIAPEWDPQRGRFGYPRRIRYVFFDSGGHVAMAKRYRAYARSIGRLKTLEEKRRENPNVDLLAGAVNVWCWDRNAVPIVRELQAAGIDRILWSNQQDAEGLVALNELGVLTSRYDIYQDVMNPEHFPRLQWRHPDWTTAAWPADLIVDRRGQFLQGWGVETRDGGMVACGVLCDRQAPPYARERITAELLTHPYRCRFIDTTTAAPWQECYEPRHPMTRTDSRKWKMELLRQVSMDHRLVTGCETGHDAAVPFLHYFEGMLSLGPFRVPDSGRRMQAIWTNVPPDVAKFQVGHAYRLPLWELVYHDCVIAQWYWGDYNNKLPSIWDRRDLFNALYGTPPMFMFNRQLWTANRDRFVQSYRNTAPIARRTAYAEMTDHRFLTPDRSVQRTAFANGTTVTVNFGDAPFQMPDGRSLPALAIDWK